jgi:GNAT superfamily N-acetyltransferase
MISFKQYLIETNIKYVIKNNTIHYFIDNSEIGYLTYEYDGSNISDHIPSTEKEFYIDMIKIYDKFRGNDYSKDILDHVKKYAKQMGATIITLKVDYGMGFLNTRRPNYGLEKIYINNGFKYMYSEDEVSNDDTKNLGAMMYKLV